MTNPLRTIAALALGAGLTLAPTIAGAEPAGPAPAMSHVEINPDGAWVVGTFPAGSGVWEVETYDPTDFDHQVLLDHYTVDATLVDVPFNEHLRIVRSGCGQLDVHLKGSDEQTGGADLRTDTCVTAPPTTVATTPPTTSPPTSTTVATTPPTTVATETEAIDTSAAQPPTVAVATSTPETIDEGTTARADQLPTTGRDQSTPVTVALTLIALGCIASGVSTVRRRWVEADRAAPLG